MFVNWLSVFFGKMTIQGSSANFFFLIGLFVFLILGGMNCLYNLDNNPLSHLLQIFSPILYVVFHFSDHFTKAFKFD